MRGRELWPLCTLEICKGGRSIATASMIRIRVAHWRLVRVVGALGIKVRCLDPSIRGVEGSLAFERRILSTHSTDRGDAALQSVRQWYWRSAPTLRMPGHKLSRLLLIYRTMN